MSISTETSIDPATKAAADRNFELMRGYLNAMMADPQHMETVPAGAVLVLLPEGDTVGFETNLAMATNLARSGHNVFLRQVAADGTPIAVATPAP